MKKITTQFEFKSQVYMLLLERRQAANGDICYLRLLHQTKT